MKSINNKTYTAMKAKNKYAAPEVQVFELKMSKGVLNNGSPYEPQDGEGKMRGYDYYSI